ncbi:MAG: hypothetical protein ACK52J_05775 [bacterium]|jgi:hypothetical protein
MFGKPFKCLKETECYLHLNSHKTSHFGPIYSNESAIGLIIATGNGLIFIKSWRTSYSESRFDKYIYVKRCWLDLERNCKRKSYL